MKHLIPSWFVRKTLCLAGFITTLALASSSIHANHNHSSRHFSITSVEFPEPSGEEQEQLIQRANKLKGMSIRREFAHIRDIDKEVVDFFVYFTAMTTAFYKRESLNDVYQFNGEDDVWRMYYGGGAAAHALFPEYFRLKREIWRRENTPAQDDIAYHELPPMLQKRDEAFQKKAASHRREGLNPKYTPYWNDKTFEEFTAFVLTLDKDAAGLYEAAFVGRHYQPDFSKAEQIADAIIRHEDRIWLFHHLNLTDCLDNSLCSLHSHDYHALTTKLVALKSDKVLAHYFPEFINSICSPGSNSCNWVTTFSELLALRNGYQEDAKVFGTLMVGSFYDFEWKGDPGQLPLTRLLSQMNLDSLRTVYLGLLKHRAFWRYTRNEAQPIPIRQSIEH